MVTAFALARYRSTVRVSALERARYSNGRVWALRLARFAAVRGITRLRSAKYSSVTQAAFTAWMEGEAELTVDIKVDVAGTLRDLTGVPSVLQETQGESQAAKWQLTILDHTGYYHPERVGGDWEGVMDSQAFGPGGDYRKKLRFTSTWGGAPYSLEGVPTSYGHTRSFTTGGRFDFSWGGVDISRKLFLPGKTFPTLRTARGKETWTTKRAAADLLDRVGIPYDLSRMEDAPIRVQHRQDGRPGDFFQALMDVLWTEWFVMDGRIVAYQPSYTGPAHWEYTSDSLILEDSLSVEAPQVINKVIARRAAESQGRSPVSVLAYGQYTETFNPPVSYVNHRLLSGNEGGVVSDLYYRDLSGSIVAVREIRSGNYPPWALTAIAAGIASVTFTWGEKDANSIFSQWPGTVQFQGQGFDSPELQEVYDPVFVVEEVDQASIDKYGEHALELSPNPLIFDSATLRRHAKGFLRKNSGLLIPQTFRVPLNHGLRPGHRVRIHDARLNSSHVRYVRQRTHSWSDDPDQRFTRMETVRYA